MDYVLHISSYVGTVAGARHFRGRVEGEHPKSCHGGTVFHGGAGPLHGKTTCAEGHELPERVDWEVEAAWTEERYERWAAKGFDDEGPAQFLSEQAVIDAAKRRFLGEDSSRWWEEVPVTGQPGDKLYLGYVATKPEYVDGQYGSVLAEVPGGE
jgi:hypothetical protein